MRRTTKTFTVALASLTIAATTVAVGAIATPAAAAPAAPAAPAPAAGQYVVKQDDTLFGIAKKLGVTLNALLTANQMTVSSTIHPGMTLIVPAGGTVAAAAPTGAASPAAAAAPATTYVVQKNDALFNIARRHGVSLNGLLQANKLKIDSVVLPGRTLTIPAGGSLTVSPTSAVSGQATPSTGAVPAAAVPVAGTSTYVVQSGDSIFAIAAKHGLKMGPLMKANSLTLTSVLAPGRTLTIPAGGTLTVSPTSTASGQATPNPAVAPAVSAKIDTVVAFAKAQLGKPWVFAAAGPDAFDCSGLTKTAYQQIGITLPHSSVLQANKGVAVDWVNQDIQAGDLIFMATTGKPGVIGHVGIAIDSKRWIHSPEFGDVVRQGFIPADDRLMAVRRYVTG